MTDDSRTPQGRGPARRTLHDQVYGTLSQGLLSGQFPPEALLSIRTLAAKLGTSAMPVRAALSRLAAARALVPGPNRSFRVPPITRDRLIELAHVRAALEGAAAELATPRITAGAIDRLEVLNAHMRQAAIDGDQSAYFANNRDFHWTIYQGSGQRLLGEMIDDLWLQNGPIHYFVYVDSSIFSDSASRHDAVIEALRRRNPVRVREAVVFDIVSANNYVIEHLDWLRLEARRLKEPRRRRTARDGQLTSA